MKFLRYISCGLLPLVALSSLFFVSCEDDDGMHIEDPAGSPVVSYIRVSDPEASDSLLTGATLGSGIVIIGENLGGTRQVWFNNLQAIVNPTWVTNRTVLVSVPSIAPTKVTDILSLVDANGDTLKYPFKVTIPPPVVTNARNEWPLDGENLVIQGNYFFEPIVVTFSGGVTGEVVSVNQTQIEVEIPTGAIEGPVEVATNFGQATSRFHLWDKRNIILDFDGNVANAWRIGKREDTDGPLDGFYAVIRGNIAANQRDEGAGAPAESPYMAEYWGHNDPDRPEGNLYPLYPNSYRDYVLKFEVKVKKWYGGYLNFVLAPWSQNNNSDVWNDPFVNARAVWGPWCEARNDDSGECDEGEEVIDTGWFTVSIPLEEFQYSMGAPDNVVYTPGQQFVETAAGSLSYWYLGSPENNGNAVEFYIDNIRIVER